MKTLLVLGATGLVGRQILAAALAHSEVGRVIAPTRRVLPAEARGDAKLDNPVVDFEVLPAQADGWSADAVLCALGTTLRQAGSKAAFRRVDHDYVVAAAQKARQAGAPTFVLCSSVGASARSQSFYLRVKGETERDLAALGFVSLTFVRPSLLDGGPRPQSRPGEAMGLWLARALRPVIPPRYRPVSTRAVAVCMLQAGLQSPEGQRAIDSDQIPAVS